MPLFQKKKDPKEQIREWKSALRKEQRTIQRQINGIQREENKVKKSITDAAKAGSVDVAKILAKEIVQSRKAVSKLYASIAQINSVMMSMDHQIASIRMAGALSKSTDVMKAMSALVRVPEIQQTMMALSKEMTKAGIMEELMQDTFESLEDESLDEEADETLDAILFEVTKGEMGKVGPVVDKTIEPEVAAESDEEEEEMRKRLAALHN